jgi:alcohol dehydrogenase class IV
MDFSFSTSGQILFQSGGLKLLHKHITGKNVMVVYDQALAQGGTLERTLAQIAQTGALAWPYAGPRGEPAVEDAENARRFALEKGCDMVAALGGGSIIDTAKAVSALITNPEPLTDFLEGIGKELPVKNQPVPLIAIPTTSGTGSEATKNAVIISREHRAKKSIRSPMLLPVLALLDPELTLSLPPAQTAASGMDALCHLIEGYTTTKHTPMTDALALEGITHAGRSLERAVKDGTDLEAREGMALASLLGGICLANAALALAHGMAPALGIVKNLGHGLACGIVLDHTMRVNLTASVERYARVGEALTGKRYASQAAAAEAAADFITSLKEATGIPKDLKGYSVTADELDELVAGSMASGTKVNPVAMTSESMRELYLKLI